MMNTSSDVARDRSEVVPVASFAYPSIAPLASFSSADTATRTEREHQAPGLSLQEVEDRLNRARSEAIASTEGRLRAEFESRARVEAEKIRHALELFQGERRDYFSRVESDVVHLALSIAAKILHREAQVDTMLVAALVRVAIEKLHDGSRVSVRVPPAEAEKWRIFLANPLNSSTVEIVEDAHLEPGDCVLETDLGSANFSIEAQLKEVERGFFDLLEKRPVIK
jgi:flagellar biosynthesis/type III secretory pathway protein FliH